MVSAACGALLLLGVGRIFSLAEQTPCALIWDTLVWMLGDPEGAQERVEAVELRWNFWVLRNYRSILQQMACGKPAMDKEPAGAEGFVSC